MGVSALIFDVDGTLAETEDVHRRAFNQAFDEAGLTWLWDEALYNSLLKVAGGKERMRHYAEQFDRLFLDSPRADEHIQALHSRKTEIYVEILRGGSLILRPGIKRLIHEARQRGVTLAIATTTTPANVIALLSGTLGPDGPGMFTCIAAADAAERKKPAPDVYLHVLREIGQSPENCIAFEDSGNGLASAVAADIPTVVTLSRYTECDDRTSALAYLSDLGDPGRPCQAHEGDLLGREFVNLDLLGAWHAADRRLIA